MKFINFSIIRFSIFLSLGIILTYTFNLPADYIVFGLVLSIIGLIISGWVANRELFPRIYFGLFTYLTFFFVGSVSIQLRLPATQKNHFSHYQIDNNKPVLIQLKISELLKSDLYNDKYIAQVHFINNSKVKGNIICYIQKDSLPMYLIDDVFLISAKSQKIAPPLNPHQFDYSKYLKSLGIEDEIRIKKQQILNTKKGSTTLRGRAETLRSYLINKLKEHPFTKDELSIIQALALGQRKDISKELYQDFAAAGVVHILAVSGLHVGIIYLILLTLFNPLFKHKKWKYVAYIITLISLWIYAFITGLSHSVIRAVTMFSFLAMATILKRETNSVNTLFLSYFTLLLINPFWLFSVGFQLSYAAVFFILWIVPICNKWYYPKNRILQKFWGILTVSLAAQLGVIPLSLYYFHQFPGLFLVSNIVILPFIGFLLVSCLIVIFLSAFNILPDSFVSVLNFFLKSFNQFIKWVSNQDSFVIEDISFSFYQAIFTYLLILCFIIYIQRKSYVNLIKVLSSIVLCIGVLIWEKQDFTKNELLVFHKSKNTLIAHKYNRKLTLFTNDSSKNFKKQYPIKEYRIENFIQEIETKKLPQTFSYKNQTVLIIDSLNLYPRKTFSNTIVLLRQSPKINLERLIDSLQPKTIIADGSNYTSYVQRWEKTCSRKKVVFHSTRKKGAYLLE